MKAAVYACCVVAVLATCSLNMAAAAKGLDLCSTFQSNATDPCLPGGRWDVVLQSCVGNGEGPGCYACYSGKYCKTFNSSALCMVTCAGGNPLMFQEYWEQDGNDLCTSSPVSYREGYQNQDAMSGPVAEISTAICDLHAEVGNAVCDGHDVVVGFGSTQVMAAAMYALASLADTANSEMLHIATQVPYYMHYPYQANVTTVENTDSDGMRVGAVFDPAANVSWSTSAEIVTAPNNPDGQMRTALGPDSQALHDYAYLWPHFTSKYALAANNDIMIFTASKMAGMAGARFGWALVRNPAVAILMRNYITQSTLGLSISNQLRMLDVLRNLKANGVNDGLFSFATAKMTKRWTMARSIFSNSPDFQLDNKCPGEVLCGAYLWVQCKEGYNCFNVFMAGGVTGVPGPNFGGAENYVRFELMMRSVEMDLAFKRMAAVVAAGLPDLAAYPELAASGQGRTRTNLFGAYTGC